MELMTIFMFIMSAVISSQLRHLAQHQVWPEMDRRVITTQ